MLKRMSKKRYKKLTLLKEIYRGQARRNVLRGHGPIPYDFNSFLRWIGLQGTFNSLYDKWVKSGQLTDLIPSVDRMDNDTGYSLDNIRLTTWADNNRQGNLSKRIPVVQYSLDGKFIKNHDSISEANEFIGKRTRDTGIQDAINNKQLSTYGFLWFDKYKITKKQVERAVIKERERFGVCHYFKDDKKGMRLVIYRKVSEMADDLIKSGYSGVSRNNLFRKLSNYDNKEFFYYRDRKKYI